MATTQSIPFDIITQILSKLPVKSLMRFKCVAKSWNSLITSKKFIKLHLKQSLNSKNLPKLINSHSTSLSVTVTDTALDFSEVDHPLRHLPTHNPVEIDGSCNGIVCITPYDKKSVYLYNPSTKTHRLIPPFGTSSNVKPYFDMFDQSNMNLAVFGFGYDSSKDDYKVLRMLQNNVHREASVYSLKNDSWKNVEDNTPVEYRVQISKGVLVNEKLHFSAVKVLEGYKFGRVVKCFDLSTNTFSIMEIPNIVEKFYFFDFVMSELRGCFCLLVNHFDVDVNAVALGRKLVFSELWMKKEGWVKMFSIDNPSRIGASLYMRPIVYSKDGRRVLMQVESSMLVWYDFGSNEVERVVIHGLPWKDGKGQSINAWTFVESLVSLGKDEDEQHVNIVANQKKNEEETGKGKVVVSQKKNKDDSGKFLSKGFKLRL